MSESNYSALGTCGCGKQFEQRAGRGRRQKHCGTACRDAAKNRKPPKPYARLGERAFNCANCGDGFTASHKRKFCGTKCRDEAHRRSNGIQPARHIANCRCQHCGSEYKPKKSDRTTYCSRECSYAALAQARIERGVKRVCSVHAAYCAACSLPFVSKNKQTYCERRECRSKRWCDSSRERAVRAHDASVKAKICRICEKSFIPAYGSNGRITCGPACQKKHKSENSGGSNAQRAKKFGVDRGYFNEMRIFERDRWRCQLCGVKTPKALRGTYDPRAPELDHIVPLSKGGAHRQENVQCACRKCNGEKADRAMGQMWLLGMADTIVRR